MLLLDRISAVKEIQPIRVVQAILNGPASMEECKDYISKECVTLDTNDIAINWATIEETLFKASVRDVNILNNRTEMLKLVGEDACVKNIFKKVLSKNLRFVFESVLQN